MYKHFFKRFFDVFFSLLAILILSPLFIIVAVLVGVTSKGPIIFKQQRIGRNGKVFNIFKFRSMRVGAEKEEGGVFSGKGDKRVTKVGKIIRATSIDELPQLFNILRGDMSIIGPRPPLTYHPWPIEDYTEEQKKMFLMRPGLTGWAQTHGRKCVEWHKRIELNVWYVEHVSFWLDVKILFLTVFKVLAAKDNENKGSTVASPVGENNSEEKAAQAENVIGETAEEETVKEAAATDDGAVKPADKNAEIEDKGQGDGA